ncbi:unnamed protein product, partial [marine sediment metagenome]
MVPITPYDVSQNFTTGGDVAVYTLNGAPSWMEISASEGIITGTPDDFVNTSGITVTGTNTSGSDTSNAFSTNMVEFAFTIRTIGASESFTVPGRSGQPYNGTIDYGDGSPTESFSAFDDPNFTHIYADADDYQIKITGIFSTIYFNNTGDLNATISVENWGDVGWNRLDSAFFGCLNLTTITATDGQNLSGAGQCGSAFRGAGLTALDTSTWDTTNAQDIAFFVFQCDDLVTLNLNGFNTG